jgi:3-oxoacyl-[acyl-carrier protein] reductase
MPIAYIALGSNLGDRVANLRGATQRLRAEPGMRVLAASRWYETAPVGGPLGQGAYLNAAIQLETSLSPQDLLAFLHQVENQFSRVRVMKDGPRTLDLDLLLYDDVVLTQPSIIVPHPRLHERLFMLIPLAELAEDKVLPTQQRTVQQVLDELLQTTSEELPKVYDHGESRAAELVGMTGLVTGSTSGIGAAIARELERRGATIIRHGRRAKFDCEHYLSADLNHPSDVDHLVNSAWNLNNSLDILICNAGADTLTGDAAKWSFEQKLEALLNVDLKATMKLSRAIGDKMKSRGRGVILTVGWDQAETGLEGDSGQLFCAVKGAIMCFTRSLALSLAPQVRVNCLAPGWIRTAWGETASTFWQERVRHETPLGVWGLPEDLANAAAWLCSPQAGFITGQTIRVNGGAVRA